MCDQPGERLDAHDDRQGQGRAGRGGPRPGRDSEGPRDSPERRAAQVRAAPVERAEARPRKQDRCRGMRPPDRMRAERQSPRSSRLADLIGHTPLLPLKRIAPQRPSRVQLFAKAEWFNPGGSVKDRAALWMLRAAERAGLTRDRMLLDATSGNTGI